VNANAASSINAKAVAPDFKTLAIELEHAIRDGVDAPVLAMGVIRGSIISVIGVGDELSFKINYDCWYNVNTNSINKYNPTLPQITNLKIGYIPDATRLQLQFRAPRHSAGRRFVRQCLRSIDS
jgi:hypothetical protein